MPFCSHCGTEVSNVAYVCVNCGARIMHSTPRPVVNGVPPTKDNSELYGTLGIVAAILGIPLLGWILGGIGISNAKENNNAKGRSLSIASIIVSTVLAILAVIVSLIVLLTVTLEYQYY